MKKMFKKANKNTANKNTAKAIAKKTVEVAGDAVMVTTITAANCVGGGVVALTVADAVGAIDCADIENADALTVGKAVTAGCGLGIISTLCMLKRLGFFKPKKQPETPETEDIEDVEEFENTASFADAILD